MRDNKGFSLIEIAIVMIIIGILMQAILKWQNMVGQAELQTVVSNFTKYSKVANEFKDVYNCKAGDCYNASDKLQGVLDINNGDGNGNLGESSITNTISDSGEGYLFWHHLSASSLLNKTYNGDKNSIQFNENVPSSSLSGAGVIAVFKKDSRGIIVDYLELTNTDRKNSVTPEQAYYLYNKLGNKVLINNTSNTTCAKPIDSTNTSLGYEFDFTKKNKICTISYPIY